MIDPNKFGRSRNEQIGLSRNEQIGLSRNEDFVEFGGIGLIDHSLTRHYPKPPQ